MTQEWIFKKKDTSSFFLMNNRPKNSYTHFQTILESRADFGLAAKYDFSTHEMDFTK